MTLLNAEIIAVHATLDSGHELTPIAVGQYPGGEPYIKDFPKSTHALIVRPHDMQSLMAALFLCEVHPIEELILPYFPGARQDRINLTGDRLFTARSVARLVNRIPNRPLIKILDPHSDVVPAWLDNVHVFSAAFALGHETTFFSTLPDYKGIIAPDSGSTRRATSVAGLMELPVYQGLKYRNVKTGELDGFRLEHLDPGHYLVVDDICDGGGTFLGLAAQFREGVTADLYVTHGIFSQGTVALAKKYDRIYTTDSVMNRAVHGISVIQVVERMI